MARALLTALLVLLCLQAPAKAESPPGDRDEPVTIGVMEFVAKGGISQDKADSLLDVLAGEINRLGDARVVTRTDIQSMLDLEKLRRLAGCGDAECFAEISGALGMRWMVTGNVSRFGRSFVVNLKLMDVRSVHVSGRVTRRIRGGEECLIEELPEMVRELFEGVAERLGMAIPGRVTVASRHAQLLSESPSAVTVISRDDIEASGADNIPNLLRLVPGMEVMIMSGAFQAITSRTYWTYEGNHYLVLIDGREANFDPVGFPVWDLQPVFLDDIERVEVIRGPASALYGANAFTGVVSITTREIPARTSAGILMKAGEVGRTTTRLQAATRVGEWGFLINGGMDFSGDFNDPRQSEKNAWLVRALLERRWSESRRLLVDAAVSHGQGPFPTPMGNVMGRFAPSSVRLAYESRELRGQLYWEYLNGRMDIDAPIEYAGVRLATFLPAPSDCHMVDGQLQWTPPRFFEPLLLVVGGGARASYFSSDQTLDAETFSDPTSPGYHRLGLAHWEVRGGVFVHAEYALADWITVTGGTRIDYNTQTDWFVSPRLAAVAQMTPDHYLRLGVARSFRKPNFIETVGHLAVDFPEDSPIQASSQNKFLEFMTRVGAYSGLEDEEMLAFEIGYQGRFLDGRLSVGLDLYYNQLRNLIMMVPDIIEDEQGLPDLARSSYTHRNQGPDQDIIGSELSIRYSPSGSLSFLATWTHRQVYDYSFGGYSNNSPKNLITLGGRFRTNWGLLGSLYAFTRSDFWHVDVENPSGILEPLLSQHLDNEVLLIGKLGRNFELGQHVQIETGVKLFLPISPFSAPHFRYYEVGGGITPNGQKYGAEQLRRMLTAYLEGSF